MSTRHLLGLEIVRPYIIHFIINLLIRISNEKENYIFDILLLTTTIQILKRRFNSSVNMVNKSDNKTAPEKGIPNA